MGFNAILLADYSIEKNTIKISDYEMLIPSNLKIQMRKYFDLRKAKKHVNEKLFLDYNATLNIQRGILGGFILKCLKDFDDLDKKSSRFV